MKRVLAFLVILGCFANGFADRALAEDSTPALDPVLLQMIRDDAVHEDLGLDDDQISSLIATLPEIDIAWFRSRNDSPESQRSTIEDATSTLRACLEKNLAPDQLKRLAELECQALGTRMVLRPDIAERFGVTDDQRSAFLKIAMETDRKVTRINQQAASGALDAKTGSRQVAAAQKSEREQFVKVLTSQQIERLPTLTGKPFNFSKVRRTYPLAPELVSEGVSWIQGGPISLAGLRGKVVALHFYAFQCINCQRNLPHYNGWHRDYADQGLVVIGIQTPELSAERSAERVKAAAEEEGIKYPVLLDKTSSNWKEWHNTLWPTVYLIDKEGFLRRWWHGELNWNGATGEQQMRESIETLLKE